MNLEFELNLEGVLILKDFESRKRLSDFLFKNDSITDDLGTETCRYKDFDMRNYPYDWSDEINEFVDVDRIAGDIIGKIVNEFEIISFKVIKELKENCTKYQEKELKILQQILEYSKDDDEEVISYVESLRTEYKF